ncbi:hypothetical protein TrCOL_g9561 [Triparma columacea]|uniref:SAC3/GANP/THP3 conserved domain-containing protein n=1 Tax=Triparma columacea TaxID=722753 RepID=A0A9W7GLU7_9STRA|nr:hypothetical protein TrCOL_g9561 [Triparma columacea]
MSQGSSSMSQPSSAMSHQNNPTFPSSTFGSSNTFGSTSFGAAAGAQPSSNSFSSAPVFGGSISVAGATGPPPFGQPASSAVVAGASPFGQPASSSAPFGQPASSSAPFGQPASPAPFGQPASSSSLSTTANPPSSSPFTSAPVFGSSTSQAAPAPTSASPFGQPTSSTTATSSPFKASSSPFAPKMPSSSSPFSSSVTPAASLNPSAVSFKPSHPLSTSTSTSTSQSDLQKRLLEKRALLKAKLQSEKKLTSSSTSSSPTPGSGPPPHPPPKPKRRSGLLLSEEERKAMQAAAASAPTFGGGPKPTFGSSSSSSSSSGPKPSPFGGGGMKATPKRKTGLLLSEEERKAMQAAAANAPTFGGGIKSSPSPFAPKSTSRLPPSTSTSTSSLAAKNAARFAPSNDSSKSFLSPEDLKAAAGKEEGEGRQVGYESDDSESGNRDLTAATSLMGKCLTMCPISEMIQRDKESDIKQMERPSDKVFPKHWTLKDTAIKRFRRSAAAYKLDIPELVRPPWVLERTTSFIEEYVMERDRQGFDDRCNGTPDPLDVYIFVWDRTRMIRKDFILQNYTGGKGGKNDASCVRVHERIARWHTLIEHQLAHVEDYVVKQSSQNITELGQTLKSLNQFYDDPENRHLVDEDSPTVKYKHGCEMDMPAGPTPTDYSGTVLSKPRPQEIATRKIGNVSSDLHGTNEPEMRMLYMLLNLDNEGGMELTKYAAKLKQGIFDSPEVQFALKVFIARCNNNYVQFFKLLKNEASYLAACIMFKYVETTRKSALSTMYRTYGNRTKTPVGGHSSVNDVYPLANLVDVLCFESLEECSQTCRHYGLSVDEENVYWKRSEFKPPVHPKTGSLLPCRPHKMVKTIETKLNGASRLHICRGGANKPRDPEEIRREEERKIAEAARRERLKVKLEEERARRAEEERRKAEEARRGEERERERERKEKDREEEVRREREKAELQRRKEEEEAKERVKAEEDRARRERERVVEEKRREEERIREENRREEERIERERMEREREQKRLMEEARIREVQRKEEEKRIEEERRERERQKLLEEIRKAEELKEQKEVERARKILILKRWKRQAERKAKERRFKKYYDSFDPDKQGEEEEEEAPSAAPSTNGGSGDAHLREMQAEMDGIHTEFLKRLGEEEGEKFSFDDIWVPDEEVDKSVPALYKLGVAFVEEAGDRHGRYVEAARRYFKSRLGETWKGRTDLGDLSERIEVVVRELKEGDEAGCRGCNGVIFVCPTVGGGGEGSFFPADVVEAVKDIPRFLMFICDDDVGDIEGTPWASAGSQAVGSENLGTGAVVRVDKLMDKKAFDGQLHNVVRGLIAGRVCGERHRDKRYEGIRDLKLRRVSRQGLMRAVIKEIIWWGGLRVRGEDMVRAMLKGLKRAGEVLKSEVEESKKTMGKCWPAPEFGGNLGSVKDYYGVGEPLPLKWSDRNEKQARDWNLIPLLRTGRKDNILIDTVCWANGGVDKGDVAAVCLNINEFIKRGLWRRAVNEMVEFWAGLDEWKWRKNIGKDYMYLEGGVVEKVMEGAKLAAISEKQRKKIKNNLKRLKCKPESWEKSEWRDEEWGERDSEWDNSTLDDVSTVGTVTERTVTWLGEEEYFEYLGGRKRGRRELEEEEGENDFGIVNVEGGFVGKKFRAGELDRFMQANDEMRVGGRLGEEMEEKEEEEERTVLQENIREEMKVSTEYTQRLEQLLHGEILVNDPLLIASLKHVALPAPKISHIQNKKRSSLGNLI